MDTNTLDLLENKLVIEHRKFVEVKSKVLRYIQYGRRDHPFCVFGPAGVGKTTLQKHLMYFLSERLRNGWKPDHAIPVYVEAPALDRGKFQWKSFVEDIAISLGETDFQSKIDVDKAEMNMKNKRPRKYQNSISFETLEKAMKARINAVRPVAIFIDEAQNIVEGLTLQSRKAAVNRLKNWANTMDTRIFLFGTHEAKDFLNLNEQLARRIVPLYFSRYNGLDEDEYNEYCSLIYTAISALRIELSFDLGKSLRYLYNHSLGCPGVFMSWLHMAIADGIDKGISKLSLKSFQVTRANNAALRTMEIAIKQFEDYYNSMAGDFNPSEVFPEQQDLEFALEYGVSSVRRSPTMGRNKPGKQKTVRHPVHATR